MAQHVVPLISKFGTFTLNASCTDLKLSVRILEIVSLLWSSPSLCSRSIWSANLTKVEASRPCYPWPSHTPKRWNAGLSWMFGASMNASWLTLSGLLGWKPILVANANFLTTFLAFNLSFVGTGIYSINFRAFIAGDITTGACLLSSFGLFNSFKSAFLSFGEVSWLKSKSSTCSVGTLSLTATISGLSRGKSFSVWAYSGLRGEFWTVTGLVLLFLF